MPVCSHASLFACRATAFALLKAGMYVDKRLDTTRSLHFQSLISQNLGIIGPSLGLYSGQERYRAQAQVLRSGKSSYIRTRFEFIFRDFPSQNRVSRPNDNLAGRKFDCNKRMFIFDCQSHLARYPTNFSSTQSVRN
jgi:hypothetical protein